MYLGEVEGDDQALGFGALPQVLKRAYQKTVYGSE